MGHKTKTNHWAPVVSIAAVIMVLLLLLWRMSPISVKPVDASPERFSAQRAIEIIKRINPAAKPHPLGSVANDRVRDRILDEFSRIGLSARVEESSLFGPNGDFAILKNIIAEIPGKRGETAIALLTHYDSVPAAPGASDDDAGVAAILEIARIIKSQPQPLNSVIFLITDGEESGMLGARTFARDNQETMKRIAGFLNFEARGTFGPSLMFQTGPGSAWLVDSFIRNSPLPILTSIFPTMYEMLPNDTDLSIFIRANKPGLNFAYVNGLERYHTRNDSLEYLNPASLQHQGDNVFGVVNEIINLEKFQLEKGKQVYFDLAGLLVVKWPLDWTKMLSVISLLLIIVCVIVLQRSGWMKIKQFGWGLLSFPLALLAAIASGYLLIWLIRKLSGESSPWTANPFPATAAVWLIPLIFSGLVFGMFSGKSRFRGTWSGTWIWLAFLGVVVSIFLPGFAYLFIFPVICAGLTMGLFLLSGKRSNETVMCFSLVVPAAAAALVYFPAAIMGIQAMGLGMSSLITVPVAVVFASISPMLFMTAKRTRRLAWSAITAVTTALVIAALLVPAYSSGSARPLNIIYHQDANLNRAQWLLSAGVKGLKPFVDAGLIKAEKEASLEYLGPNSLFNSGPAPLAAAPPPEISVLEEEQFPGGRRLKLHLKSSRQTHSAAVFFPPDSHPQKIEIDGRELSETYGTQGSWQRINILTLPPEGIDIIVTVPHENTFDVYIIDWSFQLPPECRQILEVRPANFIPLQRGDRWLITRKVRIE